MRFAFATLRGCFALFAVSVLFYRKERKAHAKKTQRTADSIQQPHQRPTINVLDNVR
jgi:hypothetical protein